MTLTEHYFRYLQALGEGALPPPEGILLTETEPLPRAAQLQSQIQELGIPEFVRRCAALDGTEIDPALYENFDPKELLSAFEALAQPEEAEPNCLEAPKIDEPDGPRSAYEVLLDCCFLDEQLLLYLIDVLRRGAEEEFQKLALVTARKAFTREDFLYWLASKEQRASEEELICVTIMDACLDRLASQGEKELMAALISGDRATFELFRCEAPELRQLPRATFEWFAENYLQKYYPLRYLLKFNGIQFPKGEIYHDPS